MGFFSDIKASFTRDDSASVQTLMQREDAALAAEADALFKAKQERLQEARTAAGGGRPTLEQYRQACEAFAQTDQGQAMAAKGRWSTNTYADLTGQDLSGFAISDPTGKTTNSKPNLDFMDRDGDGAITDFYTNINFNEANLKNAFVDPATSFNDEIAKAKNLEGLTFNGMKQGDQFRFASSGEYKDIQMKGVDGGEIVFVRGTVNGLSIDGKEANISIGSREDGTAAVVNNLTVSEGFRIVTLDMEPGSRLINSDLRQATISMASNVQGAVFQNVGIGGNLEGLDLSGAKLYNFRVDGKLIENAGQLAQLGVTVDNTTLVAADPKLILQERTAEAGRVLGAAMASLNNPGPTAPPAAAAPAIEQVAQAAPAPASLAAATNSVEDIGKALRAQMDRIGKPLTEQENQTLAAIREQNLARAEDQRSLPPRG